MYTKQQLKELASNYSNKLKNVSNESIKEEFIASFGETKWKEEEMLSNLIPFSEKVAKHLGVDIVPIVFEDLAEVDSRIYFKEQYIAINERYSCNLEECMKCLAHEYRHLFQYYMIALFSKDDSALGALARVYKEDFDNQVGIENYTQYMMQVVEIDAYAFTRVYLKKYYKLDITISNESYSKIVDEFINRYY